MIISNKTYDVLKFIVQTVIPAMQTLIFGVCAAVPGMDLEAAAVINGILAAICTFLGQLIGISKATYEAQNGND